VSNHNYFRGVTLVAREIHVLVISSRFPMLSQNQRPNPEVAHNAELLCFYLVLLRQLQIIDKKQLSSSVSILLLPVSSTDSLQRLEHDDGISSNDLK
jgi:hypothetical protein